MDFCLLPPNSIFHFHPLLLVCSSLSLPNLLRVPDMGCSSQAPYPNLLSLISQTFPTFFCWFFFFNQISLSFLFRGHQQEKHSASMEKKPPQPPRRPKQQQLINRVQPRQLWWRYTQMGAAASISTTATAENMQGEIFSKPWESAEFRQFLSGIVRCSPLTEQMDLTRFSVCVPSIKVPWHRIGLPLPILSLSEAEKIP